jgi:hypothetical protein
VLPPRRQKKLLPAGLAHKKETGSSVRLELKIKGVNHG